jgi:hypothetical protein
MAAIGQQNNLRVVRDLRDKLAAASTTSSSTADTTPAILPSASTSTAVVLHNPSHAALSSLPELANLVRKCMKHDVKAAEVRLQRLVDLVQLALWIDQWAPSTA